MSNEQLAVLFPAGKEITINGETLNVTPFKIGELQRVFKAIEPIYGTILSVTSDGNTDKARLAMAVIGADGHNFLQVVALGLRKPIDWVEGLDVDQAIDGLLTVIEVNLDFFVQKVLPNLNERVEKIVLKRPGQGS